MHTVACSTCACCRVNTSGEPDIGSHPAVVPLHLLLHCSSEAASYCQRWPAACCAFLLLSRLVVEALQHLQPQICPQVGCFC